MLLLAVERSTSVGSVAVYRGDRPLGRWDSTAMAPAVPDLAAMVSTALAALDCSAADFDGFAVGLGPGSFSGIRAAVAFLQGMALPGGKPVLGVSSAAALAYASLGTHAWPRVAVVGDARRGQLWMAVFERAEGAMRAVDGLWLVDRDNLTACLPPDARVVSPDWGRLEALLRAAVPSDRLQTEPGIPGAEAVAELALDPGWPKIAPPLPIYLHPAVVVR